MRARRILCKLLRFQKLSRQSSQVQKKNIELGLDLTPEEKAFDGKVGGLWKELNHLLDEFGRGEFWVDGWFVRVPRGRAFNGRGSTEAWDIENMMLREPDPRQLKLRLRPRTLKYLTPQKALRR